MSAPQATPPKTGGYGPDYFTALMKSHGRRKKFNKAKRAAEEITYLNIVAMMDMMTIILVFLLKSVSFSTTSISGTQSMTLPFSSTTITPVEATKVFITKEEITVEDKKVAVIKNGVVDPKFVAEGRPYLVPSLQAALDKEAEKQSKYSQKFQGNLMILADEETPFQIIMQVLYSAGQAKYGPPGQELTFSKYRLMVQRAGGVS